MAEFNFYRDDKVSEGNLVLTKLTWQPKDFAEFAVLTKFYWLTQEITFGTVFTEQGRPMKEFANL